VGHVARTGKRRGVYRVLLGKPEGKDHFEDSGIDRRIILRWMFRKWGHGLDLFCSGWGQLAGSCKRGNELSGSIKCGEFLE
jgi:hypothetical protein